jgi:Glycosyl hydrolase family 9
MITATACFHVCYQVGNPDDYVINVTAATGSWGVPAAMPRNRSAVLIDSRPAALALMPEAQRGAGAEVLASAAAALAATSVALEDSVPAFANDARTAAARLYASAKAMTPQANVTLELLMPPRDGPGSGPHADAGVTRFGARTALDKLAYAAAWLARATGTHHVCTPYVCVCVFINRRVSHS